jgi:hypothetical protein
MKIVCNCQQFKLFENIQVSKCIPGSVENVCYQDFIISWLSQNSVGSFLGDGGGRGFRHLLAECFASFKQESVSQYTASRCGKEQTQY